MQNNITKKMIYLGDHKLKVRFKERMLKTSRWDEGDVVPFTKPPVKHECYGRLTHVATNLVE